MDTHRFVQPTNPNLEQAVMSWGRNNPQFRKTDGQFSVTKTRSGQRKAIDLIDPTSGDRVLLAMKSSREAELRIQQELGGVVLDREDTGYLHEEVGLYRIPSGSRLLARTLETSPYSAEYMERLAEASGRLLGKIFAIDQGMFSVDIHSVAVGHNSHNGNDDIHFFLTPPIGKPGLSPTNPDAIVRALPSGGLDVRDAFRQGFNGVGYEELG